MAWMGSVGIVLTDADGRVVFQVGLPLRHAGPEGLQQGLGGRGWQEALAGAVESGSLPQGLPKEPTTHAVSSVDGEPLRMHFAPLPQGCGAANIIVVESFRSSVNPHVQRLYTLGRLAAGAAHQINNLLTLASGWLQLVMADERLNGESLQSMEKVAEAVDQLGDISNNLLNFARTRADDLGTVDLNEVVRRVLELMGYTLQKSNIEFTADLADEPLMAQGSQADLCQVLLNLIMNARQAMPDGGNIRLSTRQEGGWALVEVIDQGCGIQHEIQQRVFAPFFTTRGDEGGTGLGLAVCKEVMEKHGGELVLQSEPGVGTVVTLRMPMQTRSVAVANQ